jgi:hypothetical protein
LASARILSWNLLCELFLVSLAYRKHHYDKHKIEIRSRGLNMRIFPSIGTKSNKKKGNSAYEKNKKEKKRMKIVFYLVFKLSRLPIGWDWE